jgi:hypothetical protein
MSEKQSFMNKHKPLSTKEIDKKFSDNEAAKSTYTHDMATLEENLRNFNEKTDPIVLNGKPLCWVKRPTKDQFERLIPPELMKYKNSLETVPKEISDKYEDQIYDLMAELIVEPKHDKSWWKVNSPLVFIPLFQAHMNEVYELVGINIENF